MKAKRQKKNKKLMRAYQLTFTFREPYQTLVDSDIIAEAARCKMKLGHLLESTLQGQIKPMITQCSIRHLYDLPTPTEASKKEKDAWIEVAKQAERRRCGHHELETPLSELECLLSVVDPKGSGTNKHRYVVASQDLEVRKKMRTIAGVPLVYINRSVMILEPMAGATEDVREREERGKVRAGLKGRRSAETGLKRKREEDGEDEETTAVRGEPSADTQGDQHPKTKKVKGPKAPNPLSMKKSKKDKDKQKPSVARQVEDERSVLRKAAKKDPQATEKALDASVAVEGSGADGVAEGARKRKRKRKPKDGDGGGGGVVDNNAAATVVDVAGEEQ